MQDGSVYHACNWVVEKGEEEWQLKWIEPQYIAGGGDIFYPYPDPDDKVRVKSISLMIA